MERDPDTVLGPDVVLFEDVDGFDQVDEKYGEQPPVLVVDVLSLYDRVGSLDQRVCLYQKRGIPIIWLVEPEKCAVTIYQSGRIYVLGEADELTGRMCPPWPDQPDGGGEGGDGTRGGG